MHGQAHEKYILIVYDQSVYLTTDAGLKVIKLEFILRLEIKHNDWLLANTYWLLADMCPQVANHCALFCV